MKCCACIARVAENTPKQIIILYVLTFVILLPVLCRNLHHSIYHIRSRNSEEENRLIAENEQRLAEMQPIISAYNNSVINGQSGPSIHSENVDVGITVITVSRNRHKQSGKDPRYLTQVVGRLLELLNKTAENSRKRYGLFLCNVDANPDHYEEIKPLKILLPTFQKFQNKNAKTPGIFEKEKQDYVFCLEETLKRNTSYAFLIEDDGFPNGDLIPVLETVIDTRLESKHWSIFSTPILSRNVTYVKFYHPERLLGYISLEWERLPELLAVSFVFGTVITLLFMNYVVEWKRNNIQLIWILLVIYFCLVALSVGRVNLMEMRRISAQTYQVTPAASCCTPAMLFPKHGGQNIVKQLKQVTCRFRYGKDMALEDIRRKEGFIALMVQPNLFKHIGLVSSLRAGEVDPFII